MTTVNGELPKALIRAEIVYFEPLCVMFRPDGDTQIGCRARLVEVPHQYRVFAQRRREFQPAFRRMAGEDEICARRQNGKAEPDQLPRRHRQLVGSGQPDLGGWKMSQGLTLPNAADFRPEVEALAPGSSVLGGSDMAAADIKQVIDLIVG